MLKHYKKTSFFISDFNYGVGQFLTLNLSIFILLILAIMTIALVPRTAQAAAIRIESFDHQTWQRWHKELPRPAAVVFSTTDCGHCPAVIASLSEQLKVRKIPVIVVVMDGNDMSNVSDLLQEAHYTPATRLFVFNGQTAALQYSINPKWRGITPYVALFPTNGEAQLTLGKPSPGKMLAWLNDLKK